MQLTVIANDQASTVVHPAKASFHLPPLLVAFANADRATPPGTGTLASLESGDSRLDPTLSQSMTKRATVIRFIGDQLFRAGLWATAFLTNPDGPQRRFRQRHFVMISRGQVQSNGQPIPIGHCHHFGAFAHFGHSDARSPFLAGTKLPSRKAWAHSSLFSASRRLSNARQTRSQVPSSDHWFNRLQHVVGDPYLRGRSAHAHPVFSTYKMPFKVVRSSARGRPRPGFCFGNSASITAHCSSVSSCRLMPTV